MIARNVTNSPLGRRGRCNRVIELLAGICLCLMAGTSQAQVVLNEVMADNQGVVENGPDFPDYIELHNRSTAAAAVGNMSVTDDPALPGKFVIPAGTIIPANGYLVLWCDANTASPGLHTGFGLGANTDRVQLYAADGVTLLDDISFGIAVANLSIGRIPNATGTWTLTEPTPNEPNIEQPLGTTAELSLNEWLASPSAGEDWIEVYNGSILPVALGGLVITDTAPGTVPPNRAIPALSFIGAHGYVQFFASNLDEQDADHLDFRLGAGGETLTIYGADRATVVDRVTFGTQTTDTSQGRAPDGSDNIVFFPVGLATPEESNQTPITNVVISEVLSHTDPPLEDAIELHNVTGTTVDISHWWLSDSASQPQKYRIPVGTTIAPYGFTVFYEYQFGVGPTAFSLNSAQGDDVYLSAGNANGDLTGQQGFVTFGPLRNGVSVGRYQTSQGIEFVPLSARTFGVDNPTSLIQFRTGTGLSNAAPSIGPIVISELHFSPPGTPEIADVDEFIELHNPTASTVTLYDPDFPTNTWRLRDGVSFNFPANLSIPAGGYALVVNFDPVLDTATLASFRQKFGVPPTVPIFGPYEGKLSNSGENIRLSRPDHPELDGPNLGLVPYEQVEAIDYSAASPWPTGAASTGLSLHRTHLLGYGNEPTNWFAATPTPGRADAADNLLRFTSIRLVGANVELRFFAAAGQSYELQSRPQLVTGSWATISNIPAPAVTGEITVSVPVSGPMTFYRVVVSGTP
jgi:hypothetical protein